MIKRRTLIVGSEPARSTVGEPAASTVGEPDVLNLKGLPL
jgi:hypothetical protein